jgi:replicative DNA helicase
MIPQAAQMAELSWLKQVFSDLPGAGTALEDGFLGTMFEHYRRPINFFTELGLQSATPEMIWEQLDAPGRAALTEIGHGVEFLRELAAQDAPTSDELRYSAHQLKQRRIKEIVASGITGLTSALYTDASSDSLLTALFELAAEAQRITVGGNKEYLHGEEIADYALYMVSEMYASGGVLPCGIPHIDSLLPGGGFRTGQAIAVGAWTGHGKSLFTTALADGIGRCNNVLSYFIDAEMGVPSTVSRLVQRTTGRPMGMFKDLSSELTFLTPQLSRVAGTPVVVGSPAKVTLATVLRHSQIAVNLGCKVIVWDGVTIIKNSGKGNRQEEIESVTREAKAFAREYDVLVIYSGQLNQDRPPQTGLLRPPEIEDFKGSRSFSEDADYVFLLRQVARKPCQGDEERYGISPDDMKAKLPLGTTWVKLGKDRHGGNAGEVFDLHLNGKSLRYDEERDFSTQQE